MYNILQMSITDAFSIKICCFTEVYKLKSGYRTTVHEEHSLVVAINVLTYISFTFVVFIWNK